jgi:hypothetical protein
MLSDGRFLTENDPELIKVEKNCVWLSSGQRLYMLQNRRFPTIGKEVMQEKL